MLGIETSGDFLGVSIVDEGRPLSSIKNLRRQGHSTHLVPMLKEALKMAECSLDDLYGFAISIGPGSFTGLRVGVATVKGLCFATGKPVIDIPTLDVIADNLSFVNAGLICPMLDAKKGKVYTAIYEYKDGKQKKLSSYRLVTIDEAIDAIIKKNKDVTFLGDGLALYKNLIKSCLKNKTSFAPEHLWLPSAETVARFGEDKLARGIKHNPKSLLPMYLYSNECSIKGI